MTLVAASVLAGWLRLSAIPIFIIAGILLGPSPGFPTIIEPSKGIDLLARLGIVLLLFFLGLEFSLDRLTAARRMVVVGGVIDLVLNAGLGLRAGDHPARGHAGGGAVAGLIYISSSGIVTRDFDLRRLGDDETDLVLGVLVFEDLAIAVFLGVAAALATGESVGGPEIVATAAIALAFVVAFLIVGRWATTRSTRSARALDREQLLFGALAIALGGAALAEAAGCRRRSERCSRASCCPAARCGSDRAATPGPARLRGRDLLLRVRPRGGPRRGARRRQLVAVLAVPVAVGGEVVGGYLRAGPPAPLTRRAPTSARRWSPGGVQTVLNLLAAGRGQRRRP